MKKLTLIFTAVFLLCGLFFTFPITNAHLEGNKTKSTAVVDNTPAPIAVVVPRRAVNRAAPGFASDETPSPSKEEVEFFLKGKDKKAQRIAEFQKFRTLLLQQGVPFEPNILLQSSRKELLQESNPNFFSIKTSVRLSNKKIKGAIIAETLYLPEKIELSGDTVILANRVIFEGRNVLIKGHFDISFMPINETVLTTSISNKVVSYKSPEIVNYNSTGGLEFERQFFSKNKKIAGGQITIDVSGRDSISWTELQNITDVGSEGAMGRQGAFGVSRDKRPKGADSPEPIDGTCVGLDPSGKHTGTADTGIKGQIGGNAPEYGQPNGPTKGADGNNIVNFLIPNGSAENYHFITKGGTGGDGNYGGRGGDGGDGGDGKRGGTGVTCNCIPGISGVVGNGGNGGGSGTGGPGGDGGGSSNGAQGGSGGSITVSRPSNYTGTVTTSLSPGQGGLGYQQWGGAIGGVPGVAGLPGAPGVNCGNIYGTGGQPGSRGTPGNPGEDGSAGLGGEEGDNAGTYTETITEPGGGCLTGCGGPTFCDTYPSLCNGGGGGGCTPWYYVYYLSWDGGLTWELQFSVYVGCW
jgi:hypothetical protein